MGSYERIKSSEEHTIAKKEKIRTHPLAVTYMLLWYLFSACTLFLNKHILTGMKTEPTILGAFQLMSTTVLGFVQLNMATMLARRKRLVRHQSSQRAHAAGTAASLLNMLVLGFLRFGTVLLSLISLKYVAVSFTETVKSSAPLFTVIISRVVLGEVTGVLVNVSLVPVMCGLALCSANELSFDSRGFSAALLTNLVECCQNVYCKLLMSGVKFKFTPTELQFYASISSVIIQLPFGYFFLWSADTYRHLLATRELIVYLSLNGMAFHMQSFTAYALMDYISPVTFSVANTVKRALLIWLSVLLFGNPVTPLSALGTCIVLVGVVCYTQASRLQRRQTVKMRTRVVKPRPLPISELDGHNASTNHTLKQVVVA